MGAAADRRPQPSWCSAAIAFGCGCLVLGIVCADAIATTVASWSADPLGHGYAVLPGAVYLAWIRRRQLLAVTPAPTLLPLLLVGVLWALWSQVDLTRTGSSGQSLVILTFIGLAWAVLGTPAARALLPSFAFLFFGLPLGSYVVPALQGVTTASVAWTLAMTGFDASREGYTILLPLSSWRVAEACSGINYLVASLMAGYVYALATYRGGAHRVAFVLCAAFVALLGNGIRVYGTILTGALGYTTLLEGTKHYLFGWVVFSLMLCALISLFGRWHEDSGVSRPCRGLGA